MRTKLKVVGKYAVIMLTTFLACLALYAVAAIIWNVVFAMKSNRYQTTQPIETGSISDDEIVIATSTARIRGYDVELTASDFFSGPEALRILRDTKEVFSMNDGRVYPMFGPDIDSSEWKSGLEKDANYILKWATKDITGNGTPEIGLVGYSGGAHCCDTNYIVELSNPVKVLWQQYTGDGSALVKDVNGDGIREIEVSDDVLDYWETGHASSPFPTVVFSLQNGTYKPDTKLMQMPAPSNADIENRATGWNSGGWSGSEQNCYGLNKKLLQGEEWCAQTPWEYASDLIYSGNIVSAKKYIDLAWRSNDKFTSKQAFLTKFTDQLKTGRYYSSLVDFLNLKVLNQ